jgi:hypothetical protein
MPLAVLRVDDISFFKSLELQMKLDDTPTSDDPECQYCDMADGEHYHECPNHVKPWSYECQWCPPEGEKPCGDRGCPGPKGAFNDRTSAIRAAKYHVGNHHGGAGLLETVKIRGPGSETNYYGR